MDISIEDPDKPVAPKKEVTFNKVKLEAVYLNIDKELEKIKTGQSDLTAYAINPGSFSYPAISKLKVFKANPTEDTLKDLVKLFKQDLGLRVSTHFSALLNSCIEEEPND